MRDCFGQLEGYFDKLLGTHYLCSVSLMTAFTPKKSNAGTQAIEQQATEWSQSNQQANRQTNRRVPASERDPCVNSNEPHPKITSFSRGIYAVFVWSQTTTTSSVIVTRMETRLRLSYAHVVLAENIITVRFAQQAGHCCFNQAQAGRSDHDRQNYQTQANQSCAID